MHHLGANAHGCDACDTTVLADDEEVDHSVKYLQKVGEKVGQ